MTAEREVSVRCDSCGTYAADTGRDARDARAQARADGWHVNQRGGTDQCPDCAPNTTPNPPTTEPPDAPLEPDGPPDVTGRIDECPACHAGRHADCRDPACDCRATIDHAAALATVEPTLPAAYGPTILDDPDPSDVWGIVMAAHHAAAQTADAAEDDTLLAGPAWPHAPSSLDVDVRRQLAAAWTAHDLPAALALVEHLTGADVRPDERGGA